MTTNRAHTDDCGNPILVGDLVRVVARDANRGAVYDMTSGEVVGFGRTRVTVNFTNRVGIDNVGGELLHVTTPADGRTLRTWTDVYADADGDGLKMITNRRTQ